jgi:hypothetical protein
MHAVRVSRLDETSDGGCRPAGQCRAADCRRPSTDPISVRGAAVARRGAQHNRSGTNSLHRAGTTATKATDTPTGEGSGSDGRLAP